MISLLVIAIDKNSAATQSRANAQGGVHISQIINLIISIVILIAMGTCSYHFISAEKRVRALCDDIQVGTEHSDLFTFSKAHGLNKPHAKDGIIYLAETKTFGRHACELTLKDGIVEYVRYHFAD
ncbi:MAG: hypothetical protein HRU20_27555 [Pseudomonadales bacterium]|nr:hypothetical protein [Pseudomonadales bacterium]